MGAAATIINGYAFKSRQFDPAGTPLIRIRDLFKDQTSTGYVGDYQERYLVEPGELIVGMDGDFNSARWGGPRALLNQRVCKISPDPRQLDLEYLTHILPGYLKAIHEVTSSTTVTHLSSRDIAEIPMPVPSLEVQRHVASICGVAQDKQESAQRHLAQGRSGLNQFKESVLASACRGDLTLEWRRTRAPGSETAQTILTSIGKNHVWTRGKQQMNQVAPGDHNELPEGWCWTTLGALVRIATGATPLRKRSEYYGGSIPWVTSGAVNAGLILQPSDYVTELAIQETNAKVFPAGTLLIAMYGEGQTRGRVAELGIEAATNQAVAALLFSKDSEILRPYLRIFLQRNYAQMRHQGFGGVQRNISLGVVAGTPVPLPPLTEQYEIVRKVNQLLDHAEVIHRRVTSTESRISNAQRAVLSQLLAA